MSAAGIRARYGRKPLLTPDMGDTLSEPSLPVQEPDAAPESERGFPEGTPVAEMSDTQKAAYYQYQNRKTDNKLAAFKGVTPQDVAAMRQKLEALEAEKLSADEKAVKAAADKASSDARAAADAEWRPKYQAAQLRSAASAVIKDKERLAAFMAVTDPAKFAGDDGELDEEKVSAHLTALFGDHQQHRQPAPNWGQHSGGNGTVTRPGDAGRAAAAKRFNLTN